MHRLYNRFYISLIAIFIMVSMPSYAYDSNGNGVRLPTGYTEVEYIQAPKVSYSTSQVWTVPNNLQESYNYIFEFTPLSWEDSYYGHMIGGNDCSTTFPKYGIFKLDNGWGGMENRFISAFWNYNLETRNSSPGGNYRVYSNVRTKIQMHCKNYDSSQGAEIIVDNEGYAKYTHTSTMKYISDYTVQTGVYEIPLFTTIDNRTRYAALMQFHNFKVEEKNGKAIYNYVPCKRDNDSKVGLYDVVNDAFYYPSAFTLTAGPEVQNTFTKRTIHLATAGTLPDLISESEKYTIEELTLTGELNGTDLRLLRDMCGNSFERKQTEGKLRILDLSDVQIIEGGEEYLVTKYLHGPGSSIDKGLSEGQIHLFIEKPDELPQYVFWGCKKLTSIIIPNSVKSIGDCSFVDCRGLNSVTMPNSLRNIGKAAFEGCSGLSSIYIPNSVTSIGKSAFFQCSGFSSITIPNSVESIEDETFYGCIGLSSITIPNSVKSVGDCVFSGCSGLTSINVESRNAVYDSRNNCNAIIRKSNNELVTGCKNTVIPNSVTSIGDFAFFDCDGLTSITIPNSVTSIGYLAFGNCIGLSSITIPNSVTSIVAYSFSGCDLKDVISEIATPFEISEGVFSVYSTATLTVPQGTKSAYQSTNYWNKFSNIVESSLQYKSLDDYIAVSSITKSNDGNSVVINPIIHGIETIYIDLTKKHTTESYCYIQIYNDQETNHIDISSLNNMVLNNVKYSILTLANNKTFDWLYYNPNNKNEVIIEVEKYLGGFGHVRGWQKNFGTSSVVNIITDDSVINNGYTIADPIDLGLSVKWASWNIGASKKGDYGGLYGAGDPTGLKTSTNSSDYYFKDGESICGTEYDLAHVKWGDNWRMPTFNELIELKDKCTWKHNISIDGVNGCTATGPNGNSIFIPYAGSRNDKGVHDKDYRASFFSGDMGTTQYEYGYKDLDILNTGKFQMDGCRNWVGQSIRPVYEEIVSLGDANGDREVNVSDIVEVVNYIMNKTSTNFLKANADLNGDGEVNVTDIVMMVNIIMSGQNSSARMVGNRAEGLDGDGLTVEDVTMSAGETEQLSICMNNSDRKYAAFQFDLTLPDGITIAKNSNGKLIASFVADRIDNHTLNVSEIGNNTYRFLAFSMSNAEFYGTSGALVNITLEADANISSGPQNAILKSQVFTATDGVQYKWADKSFSIKVNDAENTGVDQITLSGQNDNMVRAYTLTGLLIFSVTENNFSEKWHHLSSGVYIVNGQKMIKSGDVKYDIVQ